MGQQLYFDNYTPVGDIIVIAICMVMIVLVSTSYVNKTTNFSLFLNMIFYLVSASMCDIIYHDWYVHITDGSYIGVYVMRIIYHALLFSILLLYIVYIVEIQHLEKHKRIPIMIVATTIYLAVIITDIVTTAKGTGFRLNKNGTAITGINIFMIGYIAFIGEIAYLMIVYRDRIYKKVMYGFYGTMIVSFVILYLQGKHGQSSFTVPTFLFPVIAMLYLVHSTSYDIESGAVNVMAMKELIKYNYDKKKEFLFMSLYMPDFESEGKVIPPDLQATIRRFASEFFKQSVLFQISNGHVILVAPKNLNPDHENRLNKILNQFQIEYLKFQFDYKVIIVNP